MYVNGMYIYIAYISCNKIHNLRKDARIHENMLIFRIAVSYL
jgi:hypothetical protein